MRVRRGICFGLAWLLLVLTGCAQAPQPVDATVPSGTVPQGVTAAPLPADVLSLPFAARDVLNPYLAESQLNRDLGALLYEGLFALDDSLRPQPVLAVKAEKIGALQWRVVLRAGRVFHGGAAVTAADVVYSFKKAKASPRYAAHLADVSAVTLQRDGSLLLQLSRANEYLPAVLDFPIVPEKSAEAARLPQAEGGYYFRAGDTPPGTGRYALTQRGGAFVLAADTNHPGEAPKRKTLQLYAVKDGASLLYGLEMGNYQFCYDDLSSGTLQRMSAATAHVPTLNFVYLGIQGGRAALSDAKLRQVLAACLDAAKLREAFQGFFTASATPFPPAWYGLQTADFAQPYDPAAAKRRLEDLGYNEIRGGVRASKSRKLQFTLLVNADNACKLAAANVIKNHLAQCQIGVVVEALPEAEYLAAVKAGRFDLYLGEVRLTPDCSLSPLLRAGGAAAAGVNVWGKAGVSYGQLLEGKATAAQFMAVFREEQPFIPLGYREGMAVMARQMNRTPKCRPGNLFADIENW
ncbi:MAG: ABC transporter substrate-binding protein [Oscillospiraceae bacterium]|jgi:peptide/nickel transport system substrate-binding protein|nr:ABC transporter substrate-binding protein [Oscillospiraceae bacterium]